MAMVSVASEILLLPWIELPLKSLAGKEGGERERKKGLPQVSGGATVILGALRGFQLNVSEKVSLQPVRQGLKASSDCGKLAS